MTFGAYFTIITIFIKINTFYNLFNNMLYQCIPSIVSNLHSIASIEPHLRLYNDLFLKFKLISL